MNYNIINPCKRLKISNMTSYFMSLVNTPVASVTRTAFLQAFWWRVGCVPSNRMFDLSCFISFPPLFNFLDDKKSFAFLLLQRHTGIWAFTHGVVAEKKDQLGKNMQFEALWQQTHFWSYLRCNLSNLSDPLPLISCHPGEGEKVQRASQDVSACSSVDVENSSAQSGKQHRLVHG